MHLQFDRNVELPGSFVVTQGLDGDGLLNTIHTTPQFSPIAPSDDDAAAIAAWQDACITQCHEEGAEWLEMAKHNRKLTPNTASFVPILLSLSQHRWWLKQGRLCLFSTLPTSGEPTEQQVAAATATLDPGSTVQGVALYSFDKVGDSWVGGSRCVQSTSEQALPPEHVPKAGRIQYLQVHSPTSTGYVLFSVDGYPVLMPGLPSSPWFTGQALHNGGNSVWWWKVTCAAGAVMRRAVDLKSAVVASLPYGTLVQVTRKQINQAGLTRLFVRAQQPDASQRIVEGWCSEQLNPLAGMRGAILQPLPPAVPVQYEVVLPEGAVVRRGVELSSPEARTLPQRTTVPVLQRVFTEFPANNCVARLCLAHKAAYVSVRLNNGSRSEVFRPTGAVDASFDPAQPGLYHQKLHRQYVSSEPEPMATEPGTSAPTTAVTKPAAMANNNQQTVCVCCLENTANATLVHGETGHICCCLACARLCKARGGGCPLCRKPIDLVILHFYS